MKEMKQRRKKERTWAEAARLVRPEGRPGRGRGDSAVPRGLPAASGPSPSNGAGGAAIAFEGVKAGAGSAWRARAMLPVPRPVPRLPAVPPPAAVAGVSCTVVFLPQPGGKEVLPGAVRARPPALSDELPARRGSQRPPPPPAGRGCSGSRDGTREVPSRSGSVRAGQGCGNGPAHSLPFRRFKAPWEEPEPPERARPLSKVSGLITEGTGSFCAPAAPEGRWRVPICRSSSWTEQP